MTAIYLDHNATTSVAPEVAEAMALALRECYGNPSSSYPAGRSAFDKVALARRSLAELLGTSPENLVFTGSATEANNLAILGVAKLMPTHKRHLIISAIEHSAVMEPARQLEREGWSLSIIPVDVTGQVSVDAVVDAVRSDTALVSIMLANNEVGTLQPVAEIARRLRKQDVIIHTDAAQAVGKIPVNVNELGVHLLTVAGHKFRASKGIGLLYIRSGTSVSRVLYGANHEQNLRPGTENVPAIIGLGVAANLAKIALEKERTVLHERCEQLYQLLFDSIPGLQLNGHSEARLPNTLNVSFPHVSGKNLLATVESSVAASVGSACHSGQLTASGVLVAMGLDSFRREGAVRLSTGWETSVDDISKAAQALILAWQQLKQEQS